MVQSHIVTKFQSLSIDVISEAIGKMWNCGMRKVKCGIQKCGKVCGMVGKTRNAE